METGNVMPLAPLHRAHDISLCILLPIGLEIRLLPSSCLSFRPLSCPLCSSCPPQLLTSGKSSLFLPGPSRARLLFLSYFTPASPRPFALLLPTSSSFTSLLDLLLPTRSHPQAGLARTSVNQPPRRAPSRLLTAFIRSSLLEHHHLVTHAGTLRHATGRSKASPIHRLFFFFSLPASCFHHPLSPPVLPRPSFHHRRR